MPEIVLTTGCSFTSDLENSILDAATIAQVSLPYSCKTGRCSTCKCRVISGTTTTLQAETGLTNEEKAEGWILSCVRKADTDLVLEVEDLGDVTLPPAKTLPCRIGNLEKLAPDVLRINLRLPPSAEFSFIAGQYVDIIGPDGIRRSYSLANADFSERNLELHIRAVENGAMSDYWFNRAKVNDLLRLNGPLGTFFLRDVAGIDLFLLATGTGMAPIKALLESIQNLSLNKQPRSTTVLWGGRVESDLYIDIGAIKGTHRYVPVLSRSASDWVGARGYIQDVMLKLNPNLSDVAVYACGSDAMIKNAKSKLVKAGLPPNRFFSDAFVCSSNININ